MPGSDAVGERRLPAQGGGQERRSWGQGSHGGDRRAIVHRVCRASGERRDLVPLTILQVWPPPQSLIVSTRARTLFSIRRSSRFFSPAPVGRYHRRCPAPPRSAAARGQRGRSGRPTTPAGTTTPVPGRCPQWSPQRSIAVWIQPCRLVPVPGAPDRTPSAPLEPVCSGDTTEDPPACR